jgi:YidC/Oxa1 family membrane protein insertase
MDENNRNFILAIILSIGVLFAWQQFFVPKPPDTGAPPAEQQQQTEHGPPQPQPGGEGASGVTPQPGVAPAATLTREEALSQSPRVAIDTPSLKGSIALKGGRIDDLTLKDYRETVEPTSPNVVLLSPAGAPAPITPSMASSGATPQALALPPPTRCDGRDAGPLTPSSPVTLSYDNGKGSNSRAPSRSTTNTCSPSTTRWRTQARCRHLYPYALVSRHETPRSRASTSCMKA